MKQTTCGAAPTIPDADRRNRAYSGTLVTAGSGAGVVIATELGEVHRLTGAVQPVATSPTQKLARFSMTLTVAILALAGTDWASTEARNPRLTQPTQRARKMLLRITTGPSPFFTDLGLMLVGRDTVSGEWADTAVGLDGNHARITLLQTRMARVNLSSSNTSTPKRSNRTRPVPTTSACTVWPSRWTTSANPSK